MESTQTAVQTIDVIKQSGLTDYLILSGVIGNIIFLIVIGWVFHAIVSRKRK